MNINLKRPLVFIDLEITGTDIVKDRILQVAKGYDSNLEYYQDCYNFSDKVFKITKAVL